MKVRLLVSNDNGIGCKTIDFSLVSQMQLVESDSGMLIRSEQMDGCGFEIFPFTPTEMSELDDLQLPASKHNDEDQQTSREEQ